MDDKNNQIEEDRHQVSRVDLHNKKNKKDSENVKIFTLPFILVILLFLLPVAYLVTINWNNNADSFEDRNPKAGQSVSINENNQSGKDKGIVDDEDPSIDEDKETKKKEEEERIKKEEERIKKEEQEKKEKADEEKRLAAEKKKEEELEEQRKEQERKQQAEAEAERERKQQEEQKQQKKTHTVQQGETLYRIAMNYYNNPDAVDRIRAANGLSGNELSVGQNLILP